MHRSSDTRQFLPILSLLLTASMWGAVWYPLRLLEAEGLHGLWSTIISYGAALSLGLYWLWRDRGIWRIHPVALTIMMLAAGWCNAAFVLSVLEGTVVRVLLLFYLAPLWALILGWLILGEKPNRTGWLVFIVALAGAIIMLWDPSSGLPWPRDRADWLAVSAGFAFSLSNVMVRKTGNVSVGAKAAVTWLGVVTVCAVWILIADVAVPQVTLPTIGSAVALGTFGFFIMTLAVIYGVANMPVHRSAVILLFELVVGAISSMLLTDEIVLLQEWIGGALILVSAWLAARQHVGE